MRPSYLRQFVFKSTNLHFFILYLYIFVCFQFECTRMQKSKFIRNRSSSCNCTTMSDFQLSPKIRSQSLSLTTSNASSIQDYDLNREKHERINNIKSTTKSKNPLIKVLHSFRRSKDIDPETGETKLNSELNGFSLQMIAIGGSIGTGLLLGSGKSLSEGGIVPLLLGYVLVATFIYCMCQALGELSVAMPVTGSFNKYSIMFIDKSWGFAMGWNYCLQWLILLPMELVAASMTIKFWPIISGYLPDYMVITLFYGIIILMNLFSVKYYGLFEVVFSLLKVTAIVIFLIFGILIDVGIIGNERIGFRYWKDPGIFSGNGFNGFVGVVVTAAFSFSGSELVGMTASESRNPDKEVPKAIKQVFWRICGFYLLALFIIGLLVPFNHPNLVGDHKSDVNASPFVLALANTKSNAFASIMNVVILISILSVGNSAIYASSRTLIALSENGQAPRVLNYIDKKKRPLIAIAISISFGSLAYISVLSPNGSEIMFLWLMSISGISVLCTYGTITFCHIRFRKVLKLNNISYEAELPFCSQIGLTGSWYGVVLSVVITVSQIYIAIAPVNGHFVVKDFFQKVLGVLVILVFYLIHKIYLYVKYGEFQLLVDLGKVNMKFGRFANDQIRKEFKDRFEQEKIILNQQPWYIKVYNVWC